ncbi:SpaA isopeptide-forming pilin-related protein [Microcoleus sp. PH2017_16_JOR_D_A]|uniref:MSCRAMM family protein n=1 Tax=Microcoleus sp. PH2017_16_JOR_D_A TaxID=2798827 RepID=UPI0025F66CA1|nr:SpaA isopeptide-forming pilin-related protein [Microcoleus sp. PH2017_16_JOR_D_A]
MAIETETNRVFLDTNNNGALDAGEATTTSDQFGTFAFRNLRPGTYNLREVPPPGFFQTTQPLNIVLGPNQTFTCALIGNSRRYDLLVPKFRDDNRNGVQDSGEPRLANVPFTLDLNRNGRFDAATEPLVRTNAQGIALFPNLFPATYSVLEVFDDPNVPNPFPIRTGPNPVTFNVPGPNTTPSAPVPTPARTASSLDPLTEGGLDATVKASSIDTSLIANENAGISFVDDMSLSRTASALTVVLPEDKKDLLLGAPATSPTGF